MIRLDLKDRLSEKDILKYIKEHDNSRYIENQRYYEGNNAGIMDRLPPNTESQLPDNKVPMPYGRKIINTVTGYMYKPGLIKYTLDDGKYKKAIDEIFLLNDEPVKTSQIGKQTSIQGVGYELHYVQGIETNDSKLPRKAIPRFVKLPVAELIPIYDRALEAMMIAAIRHYMLDKNLGMVEVYYSDVIEYYELMQDPQSKSSKLRKLKENGHFYGRVPIVEYKNNEELIGDFEPVKYLIDAYDIMISDSVNEFDRFAAAYLVLKGVRMDEDDVEHIRAQRILELVQEGAAEFLTKDIPHEFIQFMTKLLREEIHKQSHVPDFLEGRTGDTLSGVAISKLLYDFEFIAATKEAYFREALRDRFRMINAILNIRDGKTGDPNDIEILMERNIPQMDKENAEIMEKYSGHGISKHTLIENFAPFVMDVDEELKRYKEEQEESIDLDAIYDNSEEGSTGDERDGRENDQGNREGAR